MLKGKEVVICQKNEEKKVKEKEVGAGAVQMPHRLLSVDEIAQILEEDRYFRLRYYLQKE